jgi:ABC-type lipoprotein export system ATPase subunit
VVADEVSETAIQSACSVVGAGLSHSFPGTATLFLDLDFVLLPSQITGVCGPSGCGKSTLLSILAGWETPKTGTVKRDGVRHVGWVFQNPHGVAARTALDHVVFPLLAAGLLRAEAEPEAMRIMSLFALGEIAQRPFSALSGGEAQRLMLARAVAAKPDLLLVDEPTAQLDVTTAATVNSVLGSIAASGAIVVIATHDQGTRTVCDQVIDLGLPQARVKGARLTR